MNHVWAGLACRAQGTRLYGKPLQLVGDRPIVEHLIAHLRRLRSLEGIGLAVSEGAENEVFVEMAKRLGLPWVVGDVKDVLGRLLKLANHVGAEHLLRITTENPFMSLHGADELIAEHVRSGADYSTIPYLPDGVGFEMIRVESLKISHAEGQPRHRSELVSSYIYDHQDRFKILRIDPPAKLRRPDIRLTVDYPEDLILCRRIYDALHREGELIDVEAIIDFIDAHPEVRAITDSISVDWGHGRLWE